MGTIMIVECGNIREFCEELTHDLDYVHGQVVRIRIDRTPEQEEEVSFEVGFVATVVMATPGSEWLLKFEGCAGIDDPLDNGEMDEVGSATASSWREAIEDILQGTDIRIGAGKIEI